MLSEYSYCYAECHCGGCRYAECRGADKVHQPRHTISKTDFSCIEVPQISKTKGGGMSRIKHEAESGTWLIINL